MTGAFLDVSDVLLDPEIAQTFNVTRREQTIGFGGRTVITTTALNNVVGVVTSASPNDLERLDDNQRMGRHLSIVTKTRLYGPALAANGDQFQPDYITWYGDTYIVKDVAPYPQFGAGFIQVIAGSVDAIDQPMP